MTDSDVQSSQMSIADLQSAAHAAMERRDFHAALGAWQEFRDRRPDHPEGFVSGIVALQSLRRLGEAAILADTALSRFSGSPSLLSACAQLAVAHGDWATAEGHWLAFRALAPRHPKGAIGLAQAQAGLGKLRDAEETVSAALLHEPNRVDLLVAQAELSARARDWSTAEQRWSAIAERRPGEALAVEGLAEALIQQKKTDAAQTFIKSKLPLFSGSRALAEASARISVLQTDWPEAERRWLNAAERFPSSIVALYGVAFARLKQGDLLGADDFITEAVARFPTNATLLSLYAAIAGQRGDWSEAERRAGQLRSTSPNLADGWLQQAHAHRAQGCLLQAYDLINEATAHLPADSAIQGLHYELSLALEKWADVSAHQWRSFKENPADRQRQERAFNADWRCLGAESDAEASVVKTHETYLPGNPDRDLVLRFEGFGENTEFAKVQSHFGAEPISLLRWAEITTHQLTKAIDSGFDGVGEYQNMRFRVTVDYKLRDQQHGISFHTFVKDEQLDPDHFFQSQCKRLQYLRRELLSDLGEATKIFVHKASVPVSMEEVHRLHAAVQMYGATLLFVQLCDADHPGGMVERAAPGLLMGYLSCVFSNRTGTDVSFDEWFDICRKSVALVDGEDSVPISMRDLVLRFESLGDNCEFGFVQRLAKTEPLGLFRWTLVTLPALTNAMASQFDGIGHPATTDLYASGEYLAFDPRYQLSMHTFMQSDNADRNSFYAEQCRRTVRLRKQLVADLQIGKKILVHKPLEDGNIDAARSLHSALRKLGPITLLYICAADTACPNAYVYRDAPGLLVGYLDTPPSSRDAKIDYAAWHNLLNKAIVFVA